MKRGSFQGNPYPARSSPFIGKRQEEKGRQEEIGLVANQRKKRPSFHLRDKDKCAEISGGQGIGIGDKGAEMREWCL